MLEVVACASGKESLNSMASLKYFFAIENSKLPELRCWCSERQCEAAERIFCDLYYSLFLLGTLRNVKVYASKITITKPRSAILALHKTIGVVSFRTSSDGRFRPRCRT